MEVLTAAKIEKVIISLTGWHEAVL